MSLFTDLLADPYAQRRYLAILRPYDDRTSPTSGVITLYFSENGFTTEPTDTPANTYFEPYLKSALSFNSQLIDQARVRGSAVPSLGSITLANDSEQSLDYFDELFWDGRQHDILLGGRLSDGTVLSYSDYGKIGTFTSEGVDISASEVSIIIRDLRFLLDVPLQPNLYAGTGGYEGGENLEGKPKPLCFGKCQFVQPVYLGVIGGLHTFQVHDGEVQDITAVYSSANELTRVVSSPSAGEYVVDRETGTFQLGGATLDTVISADVEGAMDNRTSPSTYLRYAGEITEYVVNTVAGVTDIDDLAIATLDTNAPYTLGIYVSSATTVESFCGRVLESVSGYYGFTRAGSYTVGRITEPETTAEFAFDTTSIFEVERLNSVRPSKQVVIAAERNWNPHSLNQIAAAVTESKRLFALNEYREHPSANDPSVVAEKHPLAIEERFETFISEAADAQTEADRLQDLYSVVRRVFRVLVKTQPFQLELGQTISLEYDRYNLTPAENFVIIGLEEEAASGFITMTVWG